MSNPFNSKFDSVCGSCGDEIYERDLVYVVDDLFVCRNCAEDRDRVCPECGDYKGEDFDTCFGCNQLMKNDNNDYENDDNDND